MRILRPLVHTFGADRICQLTTRVTPPDWIQDSIVERNRRIRNAKAAKVAYRGPSGEITPTWVWAQLWRFLRAGEPWLVISLVGKDCALS